MFRALADPSRRRLLDSLNHAAGQTLRELCAGLDMARQSVSKHLAVLEAANLVTTVRRGREKLHYLNAAPINDIAERWINHYDRGRVHALADLKRALEDPAVQKPEFVYTTYIRTTPERLWHGLDRPGVHPALLEHRLESDWNAGSYDDLDPGTASRSPTRPGRPRVRALPAARVHVAHVHARSGRRRRASEDVRAGSRPSDAPRSPSRSSRSATWSS